MNDPVAAYILPVWSEKILYGKGNSEKEDPTREIEVYTIYWSHRMESHTDTGKDFKSERFETGWYHE